MAAGGVLLAPVLSRETPGATVAYRIAFGVTVIAVVATSYIYALQARPAPMERGPSEPADIEPRGDRVLWRLRLLSLDTAACVLAGSVLLQLGLAYQGCSRTALAPGRAQRRLIRPLFAYGIAQIAGSTPGMVNVQLDQLVLSQCVRAEDLGRYAIAVSLTMLPIPIVSAIGNVAFPKLAAQRR